MYGDSSTDFLASKNQSPDRAMHGSARVDVADLDPLTGVSGLGPGRV